MTCPHWGDEADFEGYRPLHHVRTLCGKIVYERAYYACNHCHHGYCPTDKELNIHGEQTLGSREVFTLAGVHAAFAEGAERLLRQMAGLRASAALVQRVTEVVGEMISQAREESVPLQEAPRVWDWNLDENGQKVACLSLDMTSVAQQGEHGEKREGRMPIVGAIFNSATSTVNKTRRNHEVHDIHDTSGLMSLDQMRHQLRDEAQAVGLAEADVVLVLLVLLDGGAGLENCALDAVAGLSPETVLILDFPHAHDHLVEFAQDDCEDAASRAGLVSQWSHLLKEHGGPALLHTLTALDLTARSPTAPEPHRQLLGYIRNNLHRMDDPRDVRNGWPIGCGVIESACKRVIGQRLKGPGMRWHEPGTPALSPARSLSLSSDHRWEFFWRNLAAGSPPTFAMHTLNGKICRCSGDIAYLADYASLAKCAGSPAVGEWLIN